MRTLESVEGGRAILAVVGVLMLAASLVVAGCRAGVGPHPPTSIPDPTDPLKPTASDTPTPTVALTREPTPTAVFILTLTAMPTPEPTHVPAPTPTVTPTPEPTPVPTPGPRDVAASSLTEMLSWYKDPGYEAETYATGTLINL